MREGKKDGGEECDYKRGGGGEVTFVLMMRRDSETEIDSTDASHHVAAAPHEIGTP